MYSRFLCAGAAANIDIFAAAAALAADKALAAEALAVEFVPQAMFLQEGMELLQQAKDEMQQLTTAVTDAQVWVLKAALQLPSSLQERIWKYFDHPSACLHTFVLCVELQAMSAAVPAGPWYFVK